jgi:hypothetical protein
MPKVHDFISGLLHIVFPENDGPFLDSIFDSMRRDRFAHCHQAHGFRVSATIYGGTLNTFQTFSRFSFNMAYPLIHTDESVVLLKSQKAFFYQKLDHFTDRKSYYICVRSMDTSDQKGSHALEWHKLRLYQKVREYEYTIEFLRR